MSAIGEFPEQWPDIGGTVEDKEDDKLCPLKMANPNLYGYRAWNCEKERCAWWNRNLYACPLSQIGK